MDIPSVESNNNTQTDQHPLLREQRSSNNNHEHVIDIARNGGSSHTSQAPGTSSEDQPTVETRAPDNQIPSSSSIRLNSRNSFTRRSEGYHRSPLNSGLWISIELILTLSQIVASIAVLFSSRNEHPHAPLFEWIVGYASGCVATLPILYYRYWNRYQGDGREVPQRQEASSQSNPAEPSSYTAMSLTQMSEQNLHVSGATTTNSQTGTSSLRASRVVDHFKMTLDCFFAVWFVVGIVWMFGGHASSGDAPKLYRLCAVFLTFSCIGYAMPFILCLTICCCLPCIIHVLGVEENASQTRGATDESISALPTYLFKLKKNESGEDRDSNTEEGECGFLEAGTGKKRFISGEDSVCCICLAEYADGDELRELPCVHVFHVDCVDKWLKINACCPLCKSEVGERIGGSAAARESVQQ